MAVPRASITPHRIALYDSCELFNTRRGKNSISLSNLEKERFKGNLSPSAQKLITESVNWLHTLSDEKRVTNPDTGRLLRFRTNLITLTLSAKQAHDDNEIKRQLLNRFLERMRYNYGLKSYLWRAESQKNGNIHFHISSNTYIHHKELRDLWNDVQDRLQYVSRFEQRYKHRNPNSTDIHKTGKVKNMGAYLAKYMAKENEYRPIIGRQWNVSENLRGIKPISVINGGDFRQELEHFASVNRVKSWSNDFASLLFTDLFSSDLSKYPTLLEVVRTAKETYKPLIN